MSIGSSQSLTRLRSIAGLAALVTFGCGVPVEDDGGELTSEIAAADFPVRIEAGGAAAYVDEAGERWRPDFGFVGGKTVDRGAIDIAGTGSARIYQTERWGLEGYRFTVPNGRYRMQLHFAETFEGVAAAGMRVFDVAAEDVSLTGLDVFARAGGRRRAVAVSTPEFEVGDGVLDVRFTARSGQPMLNGLVITRVSSSDPGPASGRGRVHVDRGTVVTDRGTLLRGASMMILGKPGYAVDPEHWRRVRELGINVVRLDVKTAQIGKTVAEQLPDLDRAVDIAERLNMYVMFKTSIKPGNYDLGALRDFWSVAAARYKDRTHVLYELTNEPVSGPAPWGQANQWTDKVVSDLMSIYRLMRAAAPQTHIAMLSTPNLYPDCAAYRAVVEKFEGVDWRRASVSFHHYPGTERFGEANLRCLKESYPLLMTETNYWHEDGAAKNTPRTALRLYEKLGISWFSLDGKGSYGYLQNEIIPDLRAQGYLWNVER